MLTYATSLLNGAQGDDDEAPEPDMVVNYNPISETIKNIKFARANKVVFSSILAISWFWLYGLLFLSQFPVYAQQILHGSEHVVTALLMVFTVGIGVGSLLCDKLFNHSINLNLVKIGAVGLTLFGLDFAHASSTLNIVGSNISPIALFAYSGYSHVLADLLAIGFFGGLFCVPLYVLMQEKSEVTHRARIIATNNIVNALFMVVGAVVSGAILGKGVTLPQLFAGAAALNLVMAGVLQVTRKGQALLN